jgi:hypothetical protein
MAFILETIISEIYDAYEVLPGGRDPLPRDEDGKPICGNVEKARNASYRVIWVLQGGSFGSPKLGPAAPQPGEETPEAGTPPHYDALCNYWVWIWQKQNADCWNVMVDLLAAMRATVYGTRLGALNFQVPTETEGRDTELGALFVLNVTLAVPMPRDGTVPVEETSIDGFITDVKWRADLNGLDTNPVPAPDIELVIVTDP